MNVAETMRKLATIEISEFLIIDTTTDECYYYNFLIEKQEHLAYMYHSQNIVKRVFYKGSCFHIYY